MVSAYVGKFELNRSCTIKDGYDAIKKLCTKLCNKNNTEKDDKLEMCITKIFGKKMNARPTI